MRLVAGDIEIAGRRKIHRETRKLPKGATTLDLSGHLIMPVSSTRTITGV